MNNRRGKKCVRQTVVVILLYRESQDKLKSDNLCENMTSCWMSASWFSVVSGGHGKWALGGGEKPDIHFNPLWRRSLPGTICLFCLSLLFHPASSAELCRTSSAQAGPPPSLERFISAKLCLPSTCRPLPDL